MPTDSEKRPAPAKFPHKRLKIIGCIAAILAVGVAITGIASRRHNDNMLKVEADDQAVPTVAVIEPGHGDKSQALVLPGNVQAYYDAPIYARVSGYLKKWYVDIGTPVKAGQLLAEIDTPELDQQLQQTQADMASAEANAKLAETTAKRWRNMFASDAVSQQETDEKIGDAEAKQAFVAAARANMQRLQALEAFKRIVAPFAGVVTARKTDVGALINAGSGAGPELFRVAVIDKLRIYVQVPQSFAATIRSGMQATLHFPENPNSNFAATVVNTADAIAESSRTLLVQLEAANKSGELLSGSYAEVHFELPTNPDTLRLPISALLFRKNGLKIATLGANDHVVLKQVTLGRDFGTQVEVISGLSATDKVIDSPPDSLADGDIVRVASSPPTAKPAVAVTKS